MDTANINHIIITRMTEEKIIIRRRRLLILLVYNSCFECVIAVTYCDVV